MNVKKFIKILTGTLLLTSLNYAIAADVNCPPAEKIRALGSKFKYAFLDSEQKSLWTLVAEPFSWEGNSWQTLFTVYLPFYDPDEAVDVGQGHFDKSPISTQPFRMDSGVLTSCNYTPPGAIYKVVVSTPVSYGIR